MPVRVRVKNFQSIEDAEVLIDGFTSISGPNHSGKTALLRAIRGLFTNASPGPLLRTGEASLSVEIEFDDGTTILWEKGSERPGGKGKGVNRYTLNGKALSSVGRGVPPEVEALGVCAVSAGNNTIWPQIAEQFGGTVFLLNRSGAVVAEALSDVEKVGKLTAALRLSEKDKRSSSSELKVRRGDLKELQAEAEKYAGLDKVSEKVAEIEDLDTKAQAFSESLAEATRLRVDLRSAEASEEAYRGFDYAEPDGSRAKKLCEVLVLSRSYQKRLVSAQSVVSALEGFSEYSSPNSDRALKVQSVLRVCKDFRSQLVEYEDKAAAYEYCKIPIFPDSDAAVSFSNRIVELRALSEKFSEAKEALREVGSREVQLVQDLSEAERGVSKVLGDRGFCPTCKTVHGSDAHA
jgi:DNA repair exonuclease SbcCD ATPase subunit